MPERFTPRSPEDQPVEPILHAAIVDSSDIIEDQAWRDAQHELQKRRAASVKRFEQSVAALREGRHREAWEGAQSSVAEQLRFTFFHTKMLFETVDRQKQLYKEHGSFLLDRDDVRLAARTVLTEEDRREVEAAQWRMAVRRSDSEAELAQAVSEMPNDKGEGAEDHDLVSIMEERVNEMKLGYVTGKAKDLTYEMLEQQIAVEVRKLGEWLPDRYPDPDGLVSGIMPQVEAARQMFKAAEDSGNTGVIAHIALHLGGKIDPAIVSKEKPGLAEQAYKLIAKSKGGRLEPITSSAIVGTTMSVATRSVSWLAKLAGAKTLGAVAATSVGPVGVVPVGFAAMAAGVRRGSAVRDARGLFAQELESGDLKRDEIKNSGKERQELEQFVASMEPATALIKRLADCVQVVSSMGPINPETVDALAEAVAESKVRLEVGKVSGRGLVRYSKDQSFRERANLMAKIAAGENVLEDLQHFPQLKDMALLEQKYRQKFEAEMQDTDKGFRRYRYKQIMKSAAGGAAVGATMSFVTSLAADWIKDKIDSGLLSRLSRQAGLVQYASAQEASGTPEGDTYGDHYVPPTREDVEVPIERIDEYRQLPEGQVTVEIASPRLFAQLEYQQHDPSLDEYVTYDNPMAAEYNEQRLQYSLVEVDNGEVVPQASQAGIHYEPANGEVLIDASEMVADANGDGRVEFPEDKPLLAVFYLTEADAEAGRAVVVPMAHEGIKDDQLLLSPQNNPALAALFSQDEQGQLVQNFFRLGIASQNDGGGFTFYASAEGCDVPTEVWNYLETTMVPDTEDLPMVGAMGGVDTRQPVGTEVGMTTVQVPNAADVESATPTASPPPASPEAAPATVATASPEVVANAQEVHIQGAAESSATPETPSSPQDVEAISTIEVRAEEGEGHGIAVGFDAPYILSPLTKKTGEIDKGSIVQPGGEVVRLDESAREELIAKLEALSGVTPTVEKFIHSHAEALQFKTDIGDFTYHFTPAIGNFIFAIVQDRQNPDTAKARFWRISGSDRQWKVVPGYRNQDGEYLKGQEDHPRHHYAQSGKLHPDVYQAIGEALVQQGKIDPNILRFSLEGYLPVRGGEHGDEIEITESYIDLQNEQWHEYQNQMEYLYQWYEEAVLGNAASSRNMSATGSVYRRAKFDIDLMDKTGDHDSLFHLMRPYVEEVESLQGEIERLQSGSPEDREQGKRLQERLRAVGIRANNDDEPRIAHLVETYLQSVGNLLEESMRMPAPEGIIPVFSPENVKRRYFKPFAATGESRGAWIEEYEVSSAEGDVLRWAMAHDAQGRVYVDNVYDPRVGISDYGTPASIVNMGLMVYKPEDYTDYTVGIPEKYRQEASSRYTSISELWTQNAPILRQYKQALDSRGISDAPPSTDLKTEAVEVASSIDSANGSSSTDANEAVMPALAAVVAAEAAASDGDVEEEVVSDAPSVTTPAVLDVGGPVFGPDLQPVYDNFGQQSREKYSQRLEQRLGALRDMSTFSSRELTDRDRQWIESRLQLGGAGMNDRQLMRDKVYRELQKYYPVNSAEYLAMRPLVQQRMDEYTRQWPNISDSFRRYWLTHMVNGDLFNDILSDALRQGEINEGRDSAAPRVKVNGSPRSRDESN